MEIVAPIVMKIPPTGPMNIPAASANGFAEEARSGRVPIAVNCIRI